MTWLRLWSVARYDLRLSEEEWQSLWVHEFAALFSRWREVQRGEDARLAIIVTQLLQIQTTEKVHAEDLYGALEKTRGC